MDESRVEGSVNPADVEPLANPEEYLPHVRRAAGQTGEGHEHGHGGAGAATVREADHEGHHIVVRTTYEIEVDGRPVTGHVGVSNDGLVHYHAIPNLNFDSAIDLVRTLIDTFPEDFGAADDEGYGEMELDPGGYEHGGHEHGGHEHGEHEHGGHEHGERD